MTGTVIIGGSVILKNNAFQNHDSYQGKLLRFA
jgi:hypothetical protein